MDYEKKYDQGGIIIYRSKDGQISLDAKLHEETIWLNQLQIAELFGTKRPAITKHLRNIFTSKELNEHSVSSILEHTAKDGKIYRTRFYNLDAIISVGYRVNSRRATQFRIWATKVIREHIIKGYTINQKRLKEENLTELEQAVNLIKNTIEIKQLTVSEASGLLKVITDYANSWILLQKYDEGKIEIPEHRGKITYQLNYEDSQTAIQELKSNLISKKEATDIFGQERGHGFAAIAGNIYQTFGGKELYPTIEEKAVHLLYFIIKDHPFIDGNKRIGSFLFIVFLARNKYLFKKNGERKINDNALVALALLIAESQPKQKDIMIKLIMNLLSN